MVLAHRVAQEALPPHSHRFSPRVFTQHQIFACLVLKSMLRLDYRGVAAVLVDCICLRQAIGLKRPPHYTTLQKAADRLLRTAHVSKLLDSTVQRAREQKLITGEMLAVASDSTGFESHHTSQYFIHRRQRGQKGLKNPLYQTTTYRRFPKAAVSFDVATHLALAFLPGVGPSDDHSHGEALIMQAWKRVNIGTALFDAGYDSERFHSVLRHDMEIRSIIPAKIGRPTSRAPTGRYRAEMRSNFPKEIYRREGEG